MYQEMTKEELITELKALKVRLFQYQRITKGAREIDAKMNQIGDILIEKYKLTEKEIISIEMSTFDENGEVA